MRFARSIPQLRGLPELKTFDCRHCGLAVTGEAVVSFANTAIARDDMVERAAL
jgi:hypothetical protein